MANNLIGRHPNFCALIDKSMAGVATAEEEQSLREHLAACAPCAAHLEATQRGIAAFESFSFVIDRRLNDKVLAAVAARAQQLETNRMRCRRMGLGGLLALLLTGAGSAAVSRLGSMAAPLLHLAPAQMQFGLTAFWITPSILFCLLLLLLPASLDQWNVRKGVSQ